MPNPWVEQHLKPKLAVMASRDWSGVSPAGFMREVRDEIFAASRAGELSAQEEGEALRLLMDAVASIPGVGSFRLMAHRAP